MERWNPRRHAPWTPETQPKRPPDTLTGALFRLVFPPPWCANAMEALKLSQPFISYMTAETRPFIPHWIAEALTVIVARRNDQELSQRFKAMMAELRRRGRIHPKRRKNSCHANRK